MTLAKKDQFGNKYILTSLDILKSIRQFANKILISHWFAIFLIAIGIILRLRIYLAGRCLWIDEAALSLNILNRNLIGLFQPLDYVQSAPPGFLILQKLAVLLFSNNEFVLRLVPILSSCIALVFFYRIAKTCLKPNIVPLALFLFAITNQLIFFSSDAKQYSSDVLITVMLLWIALEFRRYPYTFLRMAIIGIVGGLAIWFSNPAIFILAGVGSVLIIEEVLKRDRKRILQLIFLSCFWAASFLILYFTVLKATGQNSALQAYWKSDFLVFPPKNLGDIKLDLHIILFIFNNPAGYTLNYLAPLIFIGGIMGMFWRKNIELLILLSPIPFFVTASILHYYPLNGRLMLFMVPGITLLVSEGISQIHIRSGRGSFIFTILLIALLIYDPVKIAVSDFTNPPGLEEIKPVMVYVRDNWQGGDTLYLYYSSEIAFRYYAPIVGFTAQNVIVGISSVNDPTQYSVDLAKLRGRPRVWILFSHVYDNGQGMNEENYFLQILSQWGVKEASYNATGASAYLFDLAPN